MFAMDDCLTLALLAGIVWKAGLTAATIILVTALAERAGATLAAILLGMPLSIGPALALLAFSHGNDFVAASANHALSSVFGVVLFIIAYVHAAKHCGLWGCVLAGYAAWLISALGLSQIDLNFWGGLGCAASGLLLGQLLIPRLQKPARSSTPNNRPTPIRFLLVRGSLAGVVVASVVTLAPLLGPALAGYFASIPVILGSTAWMLASVANKQLATATLSHADRGLLSFLAFCATVAYLTGPLSAYAALAVGLGVSIVVSLGLVMRMMRQSYARP